MKLTSAAFSADGLIPAKYTCDGDDINPPLRISEVPDNTQSFVLIVDDPDAPSGSASPGWVHWIVFNIDGHITDIAENSVPNGATLGNNDFNKTGWGGPCPPSGTHRYVFRLYALDTLLELTPGAIKSEVENAMNGHIIDRSELVGLYGRTTES